MQTQPTSDVERLRDLASQGRTREAAVLLLSELGERSWHDLKPDHLELLDAFCESALGGLLEEEVAWLVRSRLFLTRLTQLLEDAARSGYKPAGTVERLAKLRCITAMAEATRGRVDEAHRLLCTSAGRKPADLPSPNGQLRQDVSHLDPPDLAATAFLEGFFNAYFAFLRRVGEHDLANALEAAVQPLRLRVLEEEQRPGVVRALFYHREQQQGYVRLIHASVTIHEEEKAELRYLPFADEQVEGDMARAADVAWRVVDSYLTSHGYPDGLESRLVRWQLSTAAGDPVQAARRYGGGSIGLPLAVAILSSYLGQPVPCCLAMTGALDPWTAEEGRINAVDGVLEKVGTAVRSGYRKVFVPAGNADVLSENLVAENQARQARCAISPVARLQDVCQDTFADEKDGTFWSTAVDASRELVSLLRRPADGEKPSALQEHRGHAFVSALLLGVVFFLEGSITYLGLLGRRIGPVAWVLIGSAAAGPLAGKAFSRMRSGSLAAAVGAVPLRAAPLRAQVLVIPYAELTGLRFWAATQVHDIADPFPRCNAKRREFCQLAWIDIDHSASLSDPQLFNLSE